MLERTYKQYELRPCVYPYGQIRCSRVFRRKPSDTTQKYSDQRISSYKLPSILKKSAEENVYPSSKWQTENQIHYRIIDFTGKPRERPNYLVNKLDSRRHNPQSTQVYHIRCLNNKPVCKVKSREEESKPEMDLGNDTIYSLSFQPNKTIEKREIILRNMKENVAEGIVPFDQPQESCDVREEMMLPICETTRIPSAPNPHKYLLRKRRIQAPVPPSGVFYPDENQIPRLESVEPIPTPRIKTSISSLCGKDFTRRRYIQPPTGFFSVGNFDGGAKAVDSHKFDDKYLPFVKAKTII